MLMNSLRSLVMKQFEYQTRHKICEHQKLTHQKSQRFYEMQSREQKRKLDYYLQEKQRLNEDQSKKSTFSQIASKKSPIKDIRYDISSSYQKKANDLKKVENQLKAFKERMERREKESRSSKLIEELKKQRSLLKNSTSWSPESEILFIDT